MVCRLTSSGMLDRGSNQAKYETLQGSLGNEQAFEIVTWSEPNSG